MHQTVPIDGRLFAILHLGIKFCTTCPNFCTICLHQNVLKHNFCNKLPFNPFRVKCILLQWTLKTHQAKVILKMFSDQYKKFWNWISKESTFPNRVAAIDFICLWSEHCLINQKARKSKECLVLILIWVQNIMHNVSRWCIRLKYLNFKKTLWYSSKVALWCFAYQFSWWQHTVYVIFTQMYPWFRLLLLTWFNWDIAMKR